MLCWLRFLPQNPIISRSDGDAQHPRERVPGQCKWPSVWRNFPRLRSLPWVGGVWDPWCVWFQTTLTIFIAGKCKGSNETLPLLLHPRWERSRGHLSALPVVIPRGPPASPFLLHYKIPPREGANFSFNLVIGKKIKWKIWKVQWLLFSFLCGKFAVLYPWTIQKQNDFTCISLALLFPSPHQAVQWLLNNSITGITDVNQDHTIALNTSFCKNYPEEYKLMMEIVLDCWLQHCYCWLKSQHRANPRSSRTMMGTITGKLKIYLLMKCKKIGRQQLYLRRKHKREDVMRYNTYSSAQMSQIKGFWLKAHHQLTARTFKGMKRSFVVTNLKIRQANTTRINTVVIFEYRCSYTTEQ